MPHFEKPRKLPDPWPQFRDRVRHRWLHPFLYTEWLLRHAAYYLSRWSLLEILEYAGSFSVLVAVVLYFAETGERRQQKHYQAWQVINTAQGKGGNGGRIDALEQLNADGIALTGVDVTDAFLQDVRLDRAELRRADMGGTDMRGAHLRWAKLASATLKSANLRDGDLRNADLSDCNLEEADLTGADLRGANLSKAYLLGADLTDANLADTTGWESISGLENSTVKGVKNPPAAFLKVIQQNHPAATMPATSQKSPEQAQ